MQNEVELYESAKEREHYDNLADLYTIILATEHLERAMARDAITREQYNTECNKLISQFKMAERAALGSDMTTETFMRLYQMDCPRATERLLVAGVPQRIHEQDSHQNNVAVTVAETVQFFITTMDAVKLELRAVDELHPLLSDLMDALTRLPGIPSQFEPNDKVEHWLQKLNNLRAVDEIDEDDARQLSHDLDSAYAEFTRYLRTKK